MEIGLGGRYYVQAKAIDKETTFRKYCCKYFNNKDLAKV